MHLTELDGELVAAPTYLPVAERIRRAPVLFGQLRKLAICVCLMEIADQAAALDAVAELQPNLVKLAPEVVRRLKPERLNALWD